MTTKTLTLQEAAQYLKQISIKQIKDVRTLDIDLLIVLQNGDRIILSGGAVQALNTPDAPLPFADGQLKLGQLFQQVDQVNLSPEANLTVSSKEITRYNANNAKVNKAKKTMDEEGDKPVVAELGDQDPKAVTLSQGKVGGNSDEINYSTMRTAENQKQVAEVEVNSKLEKDWSVMWPVATGVLALLVGKGSGGGGASAAADLVPVGAATITGKATLGPISGAVAVAYDDKGNVISNEAQVVNGEYKLVLTNKAYKGLMLIAIKDANGTDGNYIDEATHKMTDLGSTLLRAVVVANGADQTVNATALTELAARLAGVTTNETNLAKVNALSAEKVTNVNKAVSNFFKVDVIEGDLAPTVISVNGKAVDNPVYSSSSEQAQYYGAALQAIAGLTQTDTTVKTQSGAIQKLSDNLQFADSAGTVLKWATVKNAGGAESVTPTASALQSNLYAESLLAASQDTTKTPEEQDAAKARYDAINNLPNGSTLSKYLTDAHVAISNPKVYIKNAVVTNTETWQLAPEGTLSLDQGDFLEGGLAAINAPVNATVTVLLTQGDNSVALPVAKADATGVAVLKAEDAVTREALLSALKQFDTSSPVTAVVTIQDGYNIRTNTQEWGSATNDVRVNVTPPASMANFVVAQPMLAEDSSYTLADSADPNVFPSTGGGADAITKKGDIKVILTRALQSDEVLQFATATALDTNGNPIFGAWTEAPSGLTSAAAAQGVAYIAKEIGRAHV